MHIHIEEVIGRAKQGITEPYICRCSDNTLYYVKGKGAGYGSLIKEWVAGRLAECLKLPIPSFAIAWVPKELYELGRKDLLQDLGFGPLFGSREIPNTNEMSFLNSESIPTQLKRDIAAFDWWIMNGDRTLTEVGGNPNILWSETANVSYIIDHNLAFDEAVTLHSQLQGHIFAEALAEICKDEALQTHYRDSFQDALSHLPSILSDIPQRWHYVDDEQSIEINFSIDEMEHRLKRIQERAFWERT